MVSGEPPFAPEDAYRDAVSALDRFEFSFKNSDHDPGSTGTQIYNWEDVSRLAKKWCYGSIAGELTLLNLPVIIGMVWENRV